MRAQVIVEENKGADESVSVKVRIEAAFGFIPRLKSLVKALEQVVGDVVGKAFNPNVRSVGQMGFDSLLVGLKPVGDKAMRTSAGRGFA